MLQRGNIGMAGGRGAVIAIDPRTRETKWRFDTRLVNVSGILTTASDLLFVGSREGVFHALDARSGSLLWKASLGGEINAAPITYEVSGKQYVAIAAGHSLFAFGLRD
jgi:outer membrane protein assembly factor BamB